MRTMGSEAALASATGGAAAALIAGMLAWAAIGHEWQRMESAIESAERTLREEQDALVLAGEARNAAGEIERYIEEEVAAAQTRAEHAGLHGAAVQAARRHEREGLNTLSAEDIEERVQRGRARPGDKRANAILKDAIRTDEALAEVFFTDRHGLNVAASGATSDFVQSDEAWWQAAWGHKVEIGRMGYDDSAGVWSMPISVRMDSREGEPIGVMKNVIEIEALQAIADEAAKNSVGGRAYIAEQSGALIAETSSGHAPTRLGNPEIDLRTEQPSTTPAFSGEVSGVGRGGEEWATGFARTRSESGVDWIVIVQRRTRTQPSMGRLDEIRMIGERASSVALGCVLAGVIGVLVGGMLTARARGRRTGREIRGIGERAQANCEGEWTQMRSIEGGEELQEMNRSVGRMARVLRQIAREQMKLKRAMKAR